jgi:DNA-binding transcriptional ArsR family regulator
MVQNIQKPDGPLPESQSSLPTKDAVLSALADRRRRAILTFLREQQSVHFTELVEYVANEQKDAAQRWPSAADERRTVIRLHHIDLPLLIDVGLITYDERSGMISPTSAAINLSSVFFVTDE